MNFFPKWLVPTAAAAAVVIAVVVVQPWDAKAPSVSPDETAIHRIGARAFGVLSASNVSNTAPASRNAGSLTSAVAAASEMSAESTKDAITIAPAPTEPYVYTAYAYEYVGDDLALPERELDVLERSIPSRANVTADLLALLGNGALNLASFGSLSVDYITLSQSDGYSIFLNSQDGSVGLYRTANSEQPAAMGTNPLPDSDVIEIANDFLRKHGVETAGYGQPIVSLSSFYGSPVPMLERSSVTDIAYYSNTQQVIYPTRIGTTQTFGLWGEPVGMTVTVDSASREVTSVYGLTTRQYTSSAYAGVTDVRDILDVVERGGLYGSKEVPGEHVNVVTLRLGTPERVYANMYRYAGAIARDLLVPALKFPVENPESGTPTAIVVPLVRELLEIDRPVIEPAVRDSGQTSPGASGSDAVPSTPETTDPVRL